MLNLKKTRPKYRVQGNVGWWNFRRTDSKDCPHSNTVFEVGIHLIGYWFWTAYESLGGFSFFIERLITPTIKNTFRKTVRKAVIIIFFSLVLGVFQLDPCFISSKQGVFKRFPRRSVYKYYNFKGCRNNCEFHYCPLTCLIAVRSFWLVSITQYITTRWRWRLASCAILLHYYRY